MTRSSMCWQGRSVRTGRCRRVVRIRRQPNRLRLLRAASPDTVRVDGSSTVYPITEAVAEEFRNEHPEVRAVDRVLGHRRRLQEVRRR